MSGDHPHCLLQRNKREILAAFDALIAETTAEDAFTRLEAAKALGALGDPRARPALMALITDNTQPERRDEAGLWLVRDSQSVAQAAKAALRKLRWRRFQPAKRH